MKTFLVLSVLLLTQFANAKPKPHSHKSSGPPRETEESKEDLRFAVLDSLIDSWNARIHSGKDIDETFLKKLSAKQRAEFRVTTDSLGAAPVISRNGHDLFFELDNIKAMIRWPHLANTEMSIGGVNFAYDPSVSVAKNLRMFDQRMGINDRSAFILNPLNFFVPEANAFVQLKFFQYLIKSKTGVWIHETYDKVKCSATICNWLLNFTGIATITTSTDLKCWAISFARPWTWAVMPMCQGYKKDLDEKKALETASMLKETGAKDGKKWVGREWSCPKLDKDTFVYTAWVRQIQIIDDSHNQELGNWRFLKAKFSRGDSPKLLDAQTFASEEDSKKPGDEAALIKLNVDPDTANTQLLSIQIRVDKLDDSDGVEWKTVLRRDFDTVDYRDLWARQQSMAEGVTKLFTVCQTVEFMKQFDRSGLQSDLQSALGKAGAPVPAAAPSQAKPPEPDAKK